MSPFLNGTHSRRSLVSCPLLVVRSCRTVSGMNEQHFIAGSTKTIAAPPTVPAASVTNSIKPEFIRLSKPGTLCPWTGLSRSKLNELILPCPANDHKPPVRAICLRKKGARRGVRLISHDSLLTYLRNLETEGGESK